MDERRPGVEGDALTADGSRRTAAASGHVAGVVVAVVAGLVISGPVVLALVVAPLGPLVVALVARRSAPFVRDHVREAVRFGLIVAFWAVGIALAGLWAVRVDASEGVFALLAFLGLLLGFAWAAFTFVAVRRALEGREWRYPFVPGRQRRVG